MQLLDPHALPRTAPRKRRIAILDGARLLAALSVVFYHYTAFASTKGNVAWQENPQDLFGSLHSVTRYGWLGVEIFFLISGFVICLSAWGPRGPGQFLRSRIVRLYPAYWCAISATTLVLLNWPDAREPLDRGEIALNFTMFHQLWEVPHVDSVYWSLWVELRFYLLFLLVAVWGVSYLSTTVFCLVWLSTAQLIPHINNDTLRGELSTWLLPEYAPYFIGGIALYLLHRSGIKTREGVMSLCIAASAWISAMNLLPARIQRPETFVHAPLSLAVVEAIVTAGFLFILLCAVGAFDAVQWKWLGVAGAITYPLYLLHENIGWTFLRLLYERGVNHWGLLLGMVTVMVALSWCVHRWIERPGARLLHKVLNMARRPQRHHREPGHQRQRKPTHSYAGQEQRRKNPPSSRGTHRKRDLLIRS